MRRLLPPLLLAACGDETMSYPLDDTLALHHVQAKGTHNSYHLEPEGNLTPGYAYSHAPLAEQLDRQGVRQLELDLYFFDHQGLEEPPYFEVRHVPSDFETTCERLKACLAQVAEWSAAHPAHHPILILLEPKDFFDATRTAFFDVLEADVRAAFPPARLLTPADVRGTSATLREAITTRGWPTLGATRGKILFALLESGSHRRAYEMRTDRVIFTLAGETEPEAGVFLVDDPVGGFDRIRALVAQGFLVRTRADTDGVEARAGDRSRLDRALESGAQFISTDFPSEVSGIPYSVEIPAGTPSRCNPVGAPAACTSRAVEDPAFLD